MLGQPALSMNQNDPGESYWFHLLNPLQSLRGDALYRDEGGEAFMQDLSLWKKREKKEQQLRHGFCKNRAQVITSKAFSDTSCSQRHIVILAWHAVRAEEYLGFTGACVCSTFYFPPYIKRGTSLFCLLFLLVCDTHNDYLMSSRSSEALQNQFQLIRKGLHYQSQHAVLFFV